MSRPASAPPIVEREYSAPAGAIRSSGVSPRAAAPRSSAPPRPGTASVAARPPVWLSRCRGVIGLSTVGSSGISVPIAVSHRSRPVCTSFDTARAFTSSVTGPARNRASAPRGAPAGPGAVRPYACMKMTLSPSTTATTAPGVNERESAVSTVSSKLCCDRGWVCAAAGSRRLTSRQAVTPAMRIIGLSGAVGGQAAGRRMSVTGPARRAKPRPVGHAGLTRTTGLLRLSVQFCVSAVPPPPCPPRLRLSVNFSNR